MSRPLTDKQIQVLSFLEEFIEDNDFPPSIREIGEHFNINSLRGVTVHLDALEEEIKAPSEVSATSRRHIGGCACLARVCQVHVEGRGGASLGHVPLVRIAVEEIGEGDRAVTRGRRRRSAAVRAGLRVRGAATRPVSIERLRLVQREQRFQFAIDRAGNLAGTTSFRP